jgi:hypothetical protein
VDVDERTLKQVTSSAHAAMGGRGRESFGATK